MPRICPECDRNPDCDDPEVEPIARELDTKGDKSWVLSCPNCPYAFGRIDESDFPDEPEDDENYYA